jgi:hypothetical protein
LNDAEVGVLSDFEIEDVGRIAARLPRFKAWATHRSHEELAEKFAQLLAVTRSWKESMAEAMRTMRSNGENHAVIFESWCQALKVLLHESN